MGEVYLAEDTRLDRKVAIKFLGLQLSNNKDHLRRFIQEAKAASALNHPNIITIHEIGQFEDTSFIAAEYIEGNTLRQLLDREEITLAQVLEVAIQTASALSAAHQAGIVHRDIKPDNIMVRSDGIVKVLDFGLAKLTETRSVNFDAEAETRPLAKTTPGTVMGTLAYMSPEQARGKEVDARTDIWSLGVVLYEMTAGRFPFAGETSSDLVAAILRTEPPTLNRYAPEVPAELERIVTKALRKDRDQRYQVMKDLELDLKSLKQRLEFESELERSAAPNQVHSEQSKILKPATHGATVQTEAQGHVASTVPGAGVTDALQQSRRRTFLIAAALLATIAIGYFAYSRYFSRTDKTAINSVAVLPFTNSNNAQDTEYLSDGISESLINSLSQLPGVKVIARSSSFKYQGKEIDPQEVAKSLGVSGIVTGRVTQVGANLLISVELMDARDKSQVWGAQYNRPAVDLLAVQSEISKEIAENLKLRLTSVERSQLDKVATANPQAYELLLKGRFYWRKGGDENQKQAVEYFQQAIAVDPSYALAHADLSVGYSNLVYNSLLDPKEFTPKAESEARAALALDERLADAHLALANLKTNAWEWATAENEYKRAIELNPNHADARRWHAVYLTVMKQSEQAIAEVKRAVELDPLSLQMRADVGFNLLFAHRYDEALEAVQKALDLDPSFALGYSYLGYIYVAKGMYAEAIASHQEAIKRGSKGPSSYVYLGAAYARAGDTARARAILRQLQASKEYVSPGELATLYASLGDREEAFASLDRAYAAHDLQLQYLGSDSGYDPLRSDPRFANLLRKVGIPQ